MIGADTSESSTNTSSLYTFSDETEVGSAAITKVRALRSSRKNSPGWPIDTGASSHMTDNLNLFRGPLNKSERRRPIQVGGGTLWANARVFQQNFGVLLLKQTLITSPEEEYTGNKQVSDHLKVWGCVCYVHVDPKTVPNQQLHNKQVDRGRLAVFLGYSDDTIRLYWYYSADLGYAQRSSSVEFDENTKGGTIDLRLRNLPSGITGQGISVDLIDRKSRGRPKKYIQLPTQTTSSTSNDFQGIHEILLEDNPGITPDVESYDQANESENMISQREETTQQITEDIQEIPDSHSTLEEVQALTEDLEMTPETPKKIHRKQQSIQMSTSTTGVLRHFDPDRRCFVEVDSSDWAHGGILSQLDDGNVLHPVAYFSGRLSPAQINYEIHDKELLTVVTAFEHWRPELQGTTEPVSVISDHKNLEYFMNTKTLNRQKTR
ncbi:hypothetical protein K3495_g11597 [Podosphaera aphanis]|nr:hypothetical protein K3495_g11597 [Podosphaera aphanis]